MKYAGIHLPGIRRVKGYPNHGMPEIVQKCKAGPVIGRNIHRTGTGVDLRIIYPCALEHIMYIGCAGINIPVGLLYYPVNSILGEIGDEFPAFSLIVAHYPVDI